MKNNGIQPACTIKPRGMPHSASMRNAHLARPADPVLIGRFADKAAYTNWRACIGADCYRLISDVSFIGTASRIEDQTESIWTRIARLIRRLLNAF